MGQPSSGHRLGAASLPQPKNNPRSKRRPLAAGRGLGDVFKLFSLLVTHNDRCWSRHASKETTELP